MKRLDRIRMMREMQLTYAQIGKIEGISKQRVYRILNKPQPREKILLSNGEAARFIGVHPNTLRRWANEKRIDCIRLGTRRDRRFAKATLEQFLEKCHKTGTKL